MHKTLLQTICALLSLAAHHCRSAYQAILQDILDLSQGQPLNIGHCTCMHFVVCVPANMQLTLSAPNYLHLMRLILQIRPPSGTERSFSMWSVCYEQPGSLWYLVSLGIFTSLLCGVLKETSLSQTVLHLQIFM